MKKLLLFAALLLAFVVMLAAGTVEAQTTVNFDTPRCSGDGVGVYGGIDFSASPWDCESPGLFGQKGQSISWFERITVGTFKFISPAVLQSLNAATSGGSGMLTISTDAGETFSGIITTTFQTFRTGFTKNASVVTVKFPGGWTIELDDLTYNTASAQPAINLNIKLLWDDGLPVSGSVKIEQMKIGVTTALGIFPLDTTGSFNGPIVLDLTQPDPLIIQFVLLDTSGKIVGTVQESVPKMMFVGVARAVASLTVAKANLTLKGISWASQ